MSIDTFLVHDLQILRPGDTTDRYGNTIRTWDTPTVTSLKGWIHQLTQSELNDQRSGQVSEWTAFLPAGTDLHPNDRILWTYEVGPITEQVTFEVDGRPARPWRPAGEHHVEAALRVVEG